MRYSELVTEAFEINHQMIAYHATHQPEGLILKNRMVRNMDSMGTWLASSREMVQELFGPNVEAYVLPEGRYIQARQNESIEVILTNLPLIEKIFGKKIADHMARYPLTPQNRKFVSNTRRRAREKEQTALASGALSYNHRDYLRYNAPEQLERWKQLEQSITYQGDIARSKEYCQAFRDFLSHAYKGIVWAGNVGWDGWPKATNIYLVFNDDDLIPVK